MTLFLLSFALFALALLGLGLGVIFRRGAIQGSCGGLNRIPGVGSDCGGLCRAGTGGGTCPRREADTASPAETDSA